MTVLGAYDGDIELALGGDEEAAYRVTFGYYVWPHLVKWLKRAKLLAETDPRNHIPVLPPGPLSGKDFAALMIRPLYGDPDPQPNLVIARVTMLKQAIGSLGDLEELLTVELDKASAVENSRRNK